VPIMMVGLQGSGKTTTSAKLAKRLTEQGRRKVLMASLDVRRPAAMEQLAVLGQQVNVDTLPIVAGQQPAQIGQRALQAARLGGYDAVILDTAGRTTLDEAMMAEAAEVKMDALEDFYPARIADRILGMGDIISLVEKAAATIDAEKAARVAERMRKGAFDLSDLREQLMQMQQMGGMAGLMGMLPGVAKMKNQLASANLDERLLKRQVAIIDSMTPRERKSPDVLKASRKKRIAAGSGTKVEDVNRMLKMHRNMADVMKAMGSRKRGPMAGLANMLGLGGGMPSPEQMQQLAERMPGGMPGLPQGAPGVPGLPPTMPGLAPKLPSGPLLPGLGGKPPGLGGFPGFGKKK
jgi:signal recognition particle subunit SRP54